MPGGKKYIYKIKTCGKLCSQDAEELEGWKLGLVTDRRQD